MGQSRILEAGQTGMDTGTMGGTMGWMSPEEIKWDNGGSIRDAQPFQAHLSGDIHTTGSIIYYILTGGVHCFGANGLRQQVAIMDGMPDCTALRSDPVAVDLVARMVRLDPARRLRIQEVVQHPMFWDAAARLEKVRGWKSSWTRDHNLKRRLDAHPITVMGMLGDHGWLAGLDTPVAAHLSAWKHGYDTLNVLDLVRAIRNIFEHWFDRNTTGACV